MVQNNFESEIRRLAYDQTSGSQPGVVFLGGFNSNKDGTKARHLEAWAQQSGRAFLRFDYSGHGASFGTIQEGCIGDWTNDAEAIITGLTKGPQVLVGSSMGGWIALLLAKRMPERIAGLVTVAAAPDFTEEKYWSGFTAEERDRLARDGAIEIDSPYDPSPYIITERLIKDGRDNLVFGAPLTLPMPTRLLHGTADEAIGHEVSLRLLDHADARDMRLTLVKGADHRFSTPDCLSLLTETVEEVVAHARK